MAYIFLTIPIFKVNPDRQTKTALWDIYVIICMYHKCHFLMQSTCFIRKIFRSHIVTLTKACLMALTKYLTRF